MRVFVDLMIFCAAVDLFVMPASSVPRVCLPFHSSCGRHICMLVTWRADSAVTAAPGTSLCVVGREPNTCVNSLWTFAIT